MGGVGWGLQSHFHVHLNHCVEVVLRCAVVGVVTIFYATFRISVEINVFLCENSKTVISQCRHLV